jgi:hypothetical protein
MMRSLIPGQRVTAITTAPNNKFTLVSLEE